MAQERSRALQNIRNYANDVRSARDGSMDIDVSRDGDFEQRLDRTVKELQARVEEQRAALETLRASTGEASFNAPSSDKRERLRQLRALKTMYKEMTPAEPNLPHQQSLLPSVLALNIVQDSITSTKNAIADTRKELAAKELQLRRERADLDDDLQVQNSIQARIIRLKEQKASESKRSAQQIARELLDAKQKRKLYFENDTMRLHDALVDFINDHLGAMLAAEELGGPVVGDMMDIDDEMLARKTIKGKPSNADTLDDATRQDRIEQIWGSTEFMDGTLPQTEREAAGRDIHLLIEKLIAALIGQSSTDVHTRLERESAAVRFLVRSKVAQFHPKDARRLRLMDFGRELE